MLKKGGIFPEKIQKEEKIILLQSRVWGSFRDVYLISDEDVAEIETNSKILRILNGRSEVCYRVDSKRKSIY
jgi:hypothetical protein